MSLIAAESAPPSAPASIWILGAGHFGLLAAERLTRRFPHADFTVIDKSENHLEQVHRETNLPCLQKDAIDYITSRSLPHELWIVPAVPVHVAFQWLLYRVGEKKDVERLTVPDSMDTQVPNPMRPAGKTVYTSYADFICPDACSEPENICTHTGRPRPGSLFEHLASISVPGFQVSVVRSHQLAPGVGGYPSQSLTSLLKDVFKAPGRHIIATACRCHGVMDCLQWW